MRAILLIILLVPVIALADPCTVNSVTPCTPSGAQKQAILTAINAGIAAENKMKDAADVADRRKMQGDSAAELVQRQVELQWRRKMQANFDRAIRLTVKAYHLTPESTGGFVAQPRGPEASQVGWAMGIPAKWAPVFYDGDKIYMKVRGTDGKDHFIGQPIDAARDAANTFATGKVIVSVKVLEGAATSGNPGFLAFYIHHEAHHFAELIGRGWDSREQGESRTCRASLDAADIFEVDQVVDDNKTIDLKSGSRV